jgi:hypothetical protein
MKAPAVNPQGATWDTFQESKIGEAGLDIKAQTRDATLRRSQALGHSVGARFLRVVVLGGLVVATTALYFSVSQGDAGNQPASIKPPSREVAASIAEAVAELPYEELIRNFFGIALAVQAPAPEPRTNPEWERFALRSELIRDDQAMGGPW